MAEAVNSLHPDAQKVIVHHMGADDIDRYFQGAPVRGGTMQRPTEPQWQLVGVYQSETGDNPAWGGKVYSYMVIWSEVRVT